MKYLRPDFFIVFFLMILPGSESSGQEEMRIWNEFVTLLKKKGITQDKIHPYYESLKEPIEGWLKQLADEAILGELDEKPEVFRVGNHVHYLLPVSTKDGEKTTYCFSIVIEENEWFYRHLEAIFIRLDKISSLPVSTFPDVSDEMKARIRAEILWSDKVRLFNFLSKEKGKDFAFNWFKDGYGFFLAAKTWVPFVLPSRAFILYLCWNEANLKENSITLEKLNNDEAVVRMVPACFLLYEYAAHLKQQISFDDYRMLFETVWSDRAEKAGWNLKIVYEEDSVCIFHFTKKS